MKKIIMMSLFAVLPLCAVVNDDFGDAPPVYEASQDSMFEAAEKYYHQQGDIKRNLFHSPYNISFLVSLRVASMLAQLQASQVIAGTTYRRFKSFVTTDFDISFPPEYLVGGNAVELSEDPSMLGVFVHGIARVEQALLDGAEALQNMIEQGGLDEKSASHKKKLAMFEKTRRNDLYLLKKIIETNNTDLYKDLKIDGIDLESCHKQWPPQVEGIDFASFSAYSIVHAALEKRKENNIDSVKHPYEIWHCELSEVPAE